MLLQDARRVAAKKQEIQSTKAKQDKVSENVAMSKKSLKVIFERFVSDFNAVCANSDLTEATMIK